MDVSNADPAIRHVRLSRLLDGELFEPTYDDIAVEQMVAIIVSDIDSFTLLCTPADMEALAAGFLYTEGLIDSADAIESIETAASGSVEVRLRNPLRAAERRNMVVTCSCGMCGTRNMNRLLYGTQPCASSLKLTPKALHDAVRKLPSMQRVFNMTGGAHAAAIFSADGQIIGFGEDIGRHCALDKAIGNALLSGVLARESTDRLCCGLALSSRVSFEMVSKAARARIELIAAVSAPSSLAVEAAARWNITLCGFVRNGKANVYSHPERIVV